MSPISYQNRLSALLREIEVDIGSTNLSLLVLKSFAEAVSSLKGRDHHQFFQALLDLTDNINSTEPKFAIIIDSFHEILKLAYSEELHHLDEKFPLRKQKFLEKLSDLIREEKREEKELIKNAMELDVEGKEILIHDNSRTVSRVLKAFKKAGKHFRVIIAEQDPEKTGPIIENLHKSRIPFRVVPAYMIAHVEEHVDMIFLGGLTLKSTMNFVMDPGTNGLVSQFHLMKKPIYVFMVTGKFSLWHAKKRTQVFTHVDQRKHYCKPINFERIKFSHDRVPAKFMKRIVNEKGVMTPNQVEKLFKQKLKERVKSDEKFRKQLTEF
jgi:translation initiation factor 2B subunit (eIF-2B alpha/beta/delta family)